MSDGDEGDGMEGMIDDEGFVQISQRDETHVERDRGKRERP